MKGRTEQFQEMCNTYNELRQSHKASETLEIMANEKYFYNYHYMRRLMIKAFRVTGIERLRKNDNWRGSGDKRLRRQNKV